MVSASVSKLLKVAQNSSCMASPKNLNAYSSKLLSVVFFTELVFTKYSICLSTVSSPAKCSLQFGAKCKSKIQDV